MPGQRTGCPRTRAVQGNRVTCNMPRRPHVSSSWILPRQLPFASQPVKMGPGLGFYDDLNWSARIGSQTKQGSPTRWPVSLVSMMPNRRQTGCHAF